MNPSSAVFPTQPRWFACVFLSAVCLGSVPTVLAQAAADPTPPPPMVSAPPAPPPAPGASDAPATTGSPAPAARPATKGEALAEIDAGLARFQTRIEQEPSEVTKAAMKTRLTVLKQRRSDLEKRFTQERFEVLKEDLRETVKVEDKMTPAVDPHEGKAAKLDPELEAAANQAAREAALARRELTLHQAVTAAEARRLERDLEAARRDDQYRADRAAEEASRRRMDVARINSDLARLSAQIDASTVGDPNRRAELAMRLRDLEQERARLEMSAQPSTFDQLRADIQREADRAR